MRRIKAVRALAALVLAYGASLPAAAFELEDPDEEVEIVDVRALALVPGAALAQPALLLPRPHLPHEPADAAAAHLTLGDIPFDAPARGAAEHASLWSRIRAAYGLQELDTPLVQEWESWYASRPDYVDRMISRAARYLYYIVEEVEKRRMPTEIALLPMIESAYNPNAYSTAHASGIWQFIPSTGKLYGLKQNWWQDERRDVLAATRAALDYLEKLYEMFGSWELALASYNWGEGAVTRAVRRNEARGLRTDYLSLEMPAETRNYIPKLIAVKNIVADPERFGLTLAEVRNRPYFTVVSTDRHIDVGIAAKLAEMPLEEFQALNPSHNRPVIPAEAAQSILLPTDRAETFEANLQAHADALTSWQSYTVGNGERIERVAQRFGITPARLKEVNGIPARLRTVSGLTILVPAGSDGHRGDVAAAGFAPDAVARSAGSSAAAAKALKHVVKAGETLSGIAARYRVSTAQLAAQNGIRNGRIRAGQALDVAVARSPATPASSRANARRSAARPLKPVLRSTRPAVPNGHAAKAGPRQESSRARVALVAGDRD